MPTKTRPKTSLTEFVYERPWLYPKQRDAIFCPERYALIEGATKTGKTAGCMVWLLEQALVGTAGRHYWWIGSIYRTAEIAYNRIVGGLPPAVYRRNDQKKTITLLNDAVLEFRSAEKPDSLYGEDVYAAVCDEATRWREEAWHAVRSTLTATQGPARILMNVKGRKNWAYLMCRRAEAGEPDYRYTKLTAYDAVDAGILLPGEVEDARRNLPASVFGELYLSEPSDDGGNPFGLGNIAACVAPLSDAPPAVWGWDLAKSVDWTVGIALDVDGHTCRLGRWQGPWEETFRQIVTLTDRKRALVDSTGVGDPVTERLQREGGRNFDGFKFTAASKQQLMEGLAVAIQHREITFPDGPIRSELDAFEYAYSRTGVRYSAPEGMHDDCVMALALAVHHRSGQRLPFSWKTLPDDDGDDEDE